MRDLRNLPTEVLERLADLSDRDLRAWCARQSGDLLEARLHAVEMRENDDGTVGLAGYATVYEHAYDVAGGAPYGWVETMARGACDKSVAERDDVRLLFDHDGIPLARTKSGTMSLDSDAVGLRVDVPSLDLRSPLVQSVRSAMDRLDLDEMSLAFRVLRQSWNGDYTERRITEVKLYDVSVVTYPANPATVVSLRSDEAPGDTKTSGMSLALARALASV